MATKSIIKNIEISDPAEAEKLVKALEEAKKICNGAHFCVEGCETCNDKEDCDFRESEEGMYKQTYNPCDECPCGVDMRDGSGNDSTCKICEFQAQQQQIEQLKDQNDTLSATVNMFAPYIIGKKEAEVVEELKELLTLKRKNAALTADKDEQAERIMELDSGLERLRLSLQWLYEINTNRWYKEWAKEKIAEIDALIAVKP